MAGFGRALASPLVVLTLGCGASPEVIQPAVSVVVPDPEILLLETASVQNRLATSLRLAAPSGPFTFGDEVLLSLVLDNPWPESLEILAGEQGHLLDLVLEVTEWMPTGGRETLARQLLQRLMNPLFLGAREVWEQTLPLRIPESSRAAILDIRVLVRFHPAGVQLGDRRLPVRKLETPVARLLAFPSGWKSLQSDPLASLRKAIPLPQEAADRHILVSAALVPRHLREPALQELIVGLENPPNRERAHSIEAALEWLTGVHRKDRTAWQNWWRQRQNRRP